MSREHKRDQEARRERMWDPAVRWRVLQETMTWAEAQEGVRRNTPAYQLRSEAAKLRSRA